MSEPSHVVPNVTELATSVRDAASPSPPVPAMSMLVRVAVSAPDLAHQVDELDLQHYRSWRTEATARQRHHCDYVRILAHFIHEMEHGIDSPGYRREVNSAIAQWIKHLDEICPIVGWSWDA